MHLFKDAHSFLGPWCLLNLCFLCLPGRRDNLVAFRYLMLLLLYVSFTWALWVWGRAKLK